MTVQYGNLSVVFSIHEMYREREVFRRVAILSVT